MEAQVFTANNSKLSISVTLFLFTFSISPCNVNPNLIRFPEIPQEFKNEATKATRTATTVEAIRTEFPIFQALSTPSSPQFQKLDNDSSRDSRDDLHYNGERMNHVDMLDEIVAPPKVVAQSDAANANRESAAAATEEEKYLEKGECRIMWRKFLSGDSCSHSLLIFCSSTRCPSHGRDI